MSDRLILESEVIDALMRVIPFRIYHKGEFTLLWSKLECLNAIRGVPSAEVKQKWIPCSECERRCNRWENLKTSQE